MADFNKPDNNTLKTAVLSEQQDRDLDIASMKKPSANVPTDYIHWNSGTNNFERYNGTVWVDLSSSFNFVITGSVLLAQMVTVDGVGSGLDADLLDGQHGSFYLAASTYTAADVLSKLKTVDVNGTDGVNAGTFDGLLSTQFLRSDVDPTITTTSPALTLKDSDSTGNPHLGLVDFHDNGGVSKGSIGFDSAANSYLNIVNQYDTTNGVKINGNTAWHAGNDGASSGLDADEVHGVDGEFVNGRADSASSIADPNTHTSQYFLTNHANAPGTGYFYITQTSWGAMTSTVNRSQHAVAYSSSSVGNAYTRYMFSAVWSSWVRLDATSASVFSDFLSIDGAGSGLDADLLDGVQGSGYVRTNAKQSIHATDALRVSGTTVSLYKGDGTFESITTQDTNTDTIPNYSAGNAALATGSVGSYASLKGQTATVGVTKAGSGLSYAGSGGSTPISPAGTWRCMGYSANTTAITTWLRIS